MKKTYLFRVFNVLFLENSVKIGIYFYPDEKLFFCSFVLDETKFLCELFNCFGFYIEKNNDNLSFKLVGELSEENARIIWKQIESQFNSPIHKMVGMHK